MTARIVKIFVLVFWVAMTAWLLLRQPAFSVQSKEDLVSLANIASKGGPTWAGVYFIDQKTGRRVKIGWERSETTKTAHGYVIDSESRLKIVAVDYGMRTSILRNLYEAGCRPLVLPCTATADDILAEKPDGVMFSPGPGDPSRLDYAVNAVKGVLGKVPVFGICLGNQLLGHALGGKLYKLKFGHRGGNHPVRCELTGRIRITSQNHGYAVEAESMKGTGATVSMLNLNDYTVEGLECPDLLAYSIQFHAEASPGPRDSRMIFRQFVERIREPKRWREITAEVG